MSLLPRCLLLSALLALAPAAARAEVRQYGSYEVHYSLFASDFLTPEVARAYGIVRANDRAVLSVALRRAADAGGTGAVAAVISGTRSDLLHRNALEFREVREDGAIYYIADFPFRNDERLFFEIELLPEGDRARLDLDFNKTLWVD